MGGLTDITEWHLSEVGELNSWTYLVGRPIRSRNSSTCWSPWDSSLTRLALPFFPHCNFILHFWFIFTSSLVFDVRAY